MIAETPAATETPKFIGEQAAESQLASNWIGKSVYNSADENLGDVNDLLIGGDGGVDAVIIGVGGFLGIGEKEVAVGFDRLTATTDADGNIKLTVDATREELDAAPEFQTLADLRSATPAPVEPLPADPMAPAPVVPAEPAPAPAQ